MVMGNQLLYAAHPESLLLRSFFTNSFFPPFLTLCPWPDKKCLSFVIWWTFGQCGGNNVMKALNMAYNITNVSFLEQDLNNNTLLKSSSDMGH